MATTANRRGTNLVKHHPAGIPVGNVGYMGDVNVPQFSLVGIRADNGYAEPVDGNAADGFYNKVLFCVIEIDTTGKANGAVVSKQELLRDVVVLLNVTGTMTRQNAFESAYILDNDTVQAAADPLVDTAEMFQEFVSATQAYVHIR